MKNTNKKSGFTLVELAIVLVIIGLIVGGVLAGQDLIKAAEQRAAVSQFEKMDTVVNAFRGKYNAIPGDVPNPGNFGFDGTGITAANNGNGTLNGSGAATFDEEPAAFMRHLAQASLINETISGSDFTTANVDAIGNYAPISKLGKGIYFWAQSSAGVNYYMLDNQSVTNGVLAGGHTALSPIIAYNLDTKLDDGIPSTGKVIAAEDAAGTTTNVADTDYTKCYNTTPTPDAYSTDTQAHSDGGVCALRVKASF